MCVDHNTSIKYFWMHSVKVVTLWTSPRNCICLQFFRRSPEIRYMIMSCRKCSSCLWLFQPLNQSSLIYASPILHRHCHGNSHRNTLKSHTKSEKTWKKNVKKHVTYFLSDSPKNHHFGPSKNQLTRAWRSPWGTRMLALEVAKTLFHELPMDFYGRIHGLPMKNHGFYPWNCVYETTMTHGKISLPADISRIYRLVYLPSPFCWHSTATEQSFGPPPCMGSSTVQFLVMVNCLDFELVGYYSIWLLDHHPCIAGVLYVLVLVYHVVKSSTIVHSFQSYVQDGPDELSLQIIYTVYRYSEPLNMCMYCIFIHVYIYTHVCIYIYSYTYHICVLP